ncbi:MAG: DUF4160 domain-containing protein [Gammaproteobacteria bacterium]|nr:DUF4160 domain-containing protein [Gammaproteobacteria bacterium]
MPGPSVAHTPFSQYPFHVHYGNGEAKFWLEPAVELVKNFGLSRVQLWEIEQIIGAHRDEFRSAWKAYFGS